MRIIAGKFKGRKLQSFSAKHIRPTTDRVKESLFNILQFHIEGAIVLDLFSGTGNLSIEALSRGASEVIAVENNPQSIKIIYDNLKSLDIQTGIQVLKIDAFSFLKKENQKVFDLIFIDPPFTDVLADKVMLELSQTSLFHEKTIIAIESARKEKMLSEYNSLRSVDSRSYGDKILTFFKKK